MANYVKTVIDIALGEVGYLEKKSNRYLDDKTRNAGSANYTKYGRDMHKLYPSVMDFPASWCDAFVDWCFQKAYGVSNAKGLLGGNFNDYTPSSAQLYKNKNAWYTKPKVGDQIFFTNGTRICHTGLVYKVGSKYVYTVEGNTSGASDVVANGGGVCVKQYLLTNPKIAGYGRPKYDVEPVQTGTGKGYSETFPVLPPRGFFMLGDGYKTLINYPTQIKRVQQLLNWIMNTTLEVDGQYGPNTEQAVIAYQKAYGLAADGQFGKASLAKAKTIMK